MAAAPRVWPPPESLTRGATRGQRSPVRLLLLEEHYGDLHFEALWYQCFLIDTTYGYKSDHGGEHLGWALFVVAG